MRARETGVGKGLTLLLSKDNFDHAPVKFAAVPVLFGVLRILVVEELDESKRLLPPADAHRARVSRACLRSRPARGAYPRSSGTRAGRKEPHARAAHQSSAPQSHISKASHWELWGGVMVESCLHSCVRPRLARQGQLLALCLMQRMHALGPRWRPTHFIPLVHIATRLRTAPYRRIGSLAARLHALARWARLAGLARWAACTRRTLTWCRNPPGCTRPAGSRSGQRCHAGLRAHKGPRPVSPSTPAACLPLSVAAA